MQHKYAWPVRVLVATLSCYFAETEAPCCRGDRGASPIKRLNTGGTPCVLDFRLPRSVPPPWWWGALRPPWPPSLRPPSGPAPNRTGGSAPWRSAGGTLFIGGTFTQVQDRSGKAQVRSGLAAIDLATCELTSWTAAANGEVLSIAVSGSTVYVGGSFTNVGGASRSNLAALSVSHRTGAAVQPRDQQAGEGTRHFRLHPVCRRRVRQGRGHEPVQAGRVLPRQRRLGLRLAAQGQRQGQHAGAQHRRRARLRRRAVHHPERAGRQPLSRRRERLHGQERLRLRPTARCSRS